MSPGAFRMMLAAMVAFSHTAGPPIGKSAVLLFFILSGYWIAKMWQERYVRTKAPYLTFVVSRAWRLLPLYWVCYAVTLVIAWLTDRCSSEEWALMSEGGWIMHTALLLGSATDYRLLTSAWSLDYELQFYLLAPLLLMLLPRWRGALAWSGWLGCLALAVMYSFSLHPWPALVLQFMGFFGAGMMMQVTGWRPGPMLAKVSLGLFAAGLLAVCVYFVLDRAGMTFGCPWMLGLHDGRDGVLALLGAPAALASCLQPSNTWDRALGAASYPLYLVQKFVDVFFEQWLRGASMLIKSASLPLQWLTMLVVTVVLYRYFDRPVDGWRQAWVTRRLRHET